LTAGRAGEVDKRILDAARRVFLERGLAGANIEEIAGLTLCRQADHLCTVRK
jgi:hypothetical protein